MSKFKFILIRKPEDIFNGKVFVHYYDKPSTYEFRWLAEERRYIVRNLTLEQEFNLDGARYTFEEIIQYTTPDTNKITSWQIIEDYV